MAPRDPKLPPPPSQDVVVSRRDATPRALATTPPGHSGTFIRILTALGIFFLWLIIGRAPHDRWKLMLALSALLLTLLFPPFYCFFLSPIALVPLVACILRRPLRLRYLGMYYRAGIWFFLASAYWLIPVTFFGYLALVLFIALYFILFAIGVHRLVIQLRLPATLAVPLVWTAVEFIRASFVYGGFPWFLLGNALAPAPLLIQTADLFGVWGVTFLIAMLNGFIVDILRLPLRVKGQKKFSPVIARLTAAVTITIAFTLAYGVFRMGQNHTHPGPRVAVIQGNFPQSTKDDKDSAPKVFYTHADLAKKAAFATPRPDLIIWPETMVPQPINKEYLEIERASNNRKNPGEWTHPDAGEMRSILQGICNEYQVAQLIGYGSATPNAEFTEFIFNNRTLLMQPAVGGSRQPADQEYSKRHLVPFGEFVPFQGVPYVYDLLVKLTPYQQIINSKPGIEWTRFTWHTRATSPTPTTASAPEPAASEPATQAAGPQYSFGTPICFEDAMPEPSRRMASPQYHDGRKADFLANVSNDGWFQWVELEQHLQACQFRAVENRIAFARSVNTGNSGFIDSNGRLLAILPIGATDTLSHVLPIDDRITLFSHIGDLLPITCGILSTLLLAYTIVRPRRGPMNAPATTAVFPV